jgi:hypothetical protein
MFGESLVSGFADERRTAVVTETAYQDPYRDSSVREVSAPLYKCKGWMKFVGVMSIISGVLCAFTIIGIVICWLPIWQGILLWGAASAIEDANRSGHKHDMTAAMDKLKTYFTIMGVLGLIGLLVTPIYILILITTGTRH